MAISDFVKSLTKSSLLAHLKNVDQKTMKWRKDLLDAVVTKDEMTDWAEGGGIDHGELGGLTHDDHTHYLLAAGTRALTGDWDAGSYEIRAQTLEADVTTGTAPLTIASTTKVANLNVDLLDDQTGSYYLDSANFTGTNWTDLTDGGATTLHKHDHGGQDGLSDDDHTHYVLRSQWLANGFVDPAESTLAWSDANRTLTIDKVGANFKYYHDGTLYTITSSKAKQIDDTEGLWVFYFDGATLSAINSPTDTQIEGIIEDECIVAFVYWDATNNDGRLFDERHGYTMSPMTHHYLHDVLHAQYDTGMTPTDVLADQTGDLDTHAQFGLTEGKFYDEDYKHTCSEVASNVGLEVYYFDGTDLRWTTNAGFSVLTTGTGRLAYNNSGAQAEIGDNKFVLCHVFGTNIKTDAGANKACIAVQGQAEYDTLTLARAGANTEINALYTGDLPMPELIPIATFIFQTKTSYGNAVNARIRKTDTGDDYVDWRGASLTGSGGASASDHGMLSGLSDDDHTQYLLADGTRALTGDWDAGTYEVRANTFESDVATGTAPFTIASTTVNTNLNADLLDGYHSDTLPYGSSGEDIDVDVGFEAAEGYSDGDHLHVLGHWGDDPAFAQIFEIDVQDSEQCARRSPLTSSGGAGAQYEPGGTPLTISSGVVDLYCRIKCLCNWGAGLFISSGADDTGAKCAAVLCTNNSPAGQGIAMWLVSSLASIGGEYEETSYGTPNSSTIYWLNLTINYNTNTISSSFWSGAFGDKPVSPQASITPSHALPTPAYVHINATNCSNSGAYANFYEFRIDSSLSSSGTLGDLNHGSLVGLSDDDHPQYLLADATRGLTADWDVGTYEIRANTFESDVATGTAPLVVASTTKVTNLNADQLDGLHDTSFIKAAGTVALTAAWDAGGYEIRSLKFYADQATGTAPYRCDSTTVNTNLNADMVDGVHEASFALVAGTRDFTGSQSWSNAAGPQIVNSAASSTVPTLLPNKADPNTGIGWNSADQLTFVTGGVETCTFKNTGSLIIKTMDVQVDNAKYFRGTESGGVTQRSILGLDSSNDVQVGATDNTLVLNASDYVLIDNASSLSVGDFATDEITLINGTTGVISQHDSAYFTTEARVEAPEVRGKEWRTTAIDTGLLDNTASILVRWDSASGESVCLNIPYKVHVEYTISATTYYYVEGGIIQFVAVNVAGTTSRASTITGTTSVNTGAGTVAVTAPTGGGTNWAQIYIKADLSGIGTTWVDGHCEYHVINSDTSNTALSNWAT